MQAAGTDRSVDAELLSGLIDDELAPAEAQALISALCRDPQARRRWAELHRVGDALHSSEVAACHAEKFCDRVSAAIAAETTILAPRAMAQRPLRRYWLPGAAVAASAAVVAFVAMPLVRGGPDTVVSAPAAVVAQGAAEQESRRRAAATVANARALDPYLLAHRELTGGAALPRATPYLRTVVDRPESR